MDAIIVGIGTVLADDPVLTARPAGARVAARVVLDSSGRMPTESQLVRTAKAAPTLVVTAGAQPRTSELRDLGCEVLSLSLSDGRPDVRALLDELGRRRMTNVLVEGGSKVLGAFLDADAMDEAHVFLAAKLLGGGQAATPVGGAGHATIAEALALVDCRVEVVEGDFYLHGTTRAR